MGIGGSVFEKENKNFQMSNSLATHGGAGRGQGRKPGGLNQRTKALRAIAEKAIEDGVHPLEVMLENMRFFHEKADVLQTAVVTKLNKKTLNNEDAMKLLIEFQELGANRMKAQACAVDAAPYVHPRLSATNISGEITHKHEEAAEAFKVISNVLNAADAGEIIEPVKKKKVAV